MKYKMFEYAMSENIEQFARRDKCFGLSEDSTMDGVCGDAVRATRQKKAENMCLDPRWTLSENRQKCGGTMDDEL